MRDAKHRFDNELRRRRADHDRQRQLTPAYVLEPLRAALGGIAFDPCTEPDNPTGAEAFCAPPADGLALQWPDRTFVNPPYGEAREPWVEKCIEAGERGCRVALLIPASTETQISQKALKSCGFALFIRSRLMFALVRPGGEGRHEAASHASMLLLWGRGEWNLLDPPASPPSRTACPRRRRDRPLTTLLFRQCRRA